MLVLNFYVSTAVQFCSSFSQAQQGFGLSKAYEYFTIAQEVPLIVPVDTEYHFRRPESSDTFFLRYKYVIGYCCNTIIIVTTRLFILLL